MFNGFFVDLILSYVPILKLTFNNKPSLRNIHWRKTVAITIILQLDLQPVITKHFQCMEKNRFDILIITNFYIPQKKGHLGSQFRVFMLHFVWILEVQNEETNAV